MKVVNDTSICYRDAIEADCSQIAALNRIWCAAYVDGRLDKGFLRNPMVEEDIENVVIDRCAMVAEASERVVGYYLCDNVRETETTRARRTMVSSLILNGLLQSGRYVYMTQAGMDPAWQGRGIGKQLLRNLKARVADRFDYLVGVIYDGNEHGMLANTRSGWRVVGGVEGGHLVITSTAETVSL